MANNRNTRRQHPRWGQSQFRSQGRAKRPREVSDQPQNQILPAIRPEWEIVYGTHAVEAVITEARRGVHYLLIQEGALTQADGTLLQQARVANIETRILPRRGLDTLTEYASHQGIVAVVDPLPRITFKDMLSALNSQPKALIVLTDRIQDPHNFGAIIRTCEAFGVDFVLTSTDKSAPLQRAVAKTAAGSLERMPICQVGNLMPAIEDLKKSGFWICCLEAGATESVLTFAAPPKCALVIGSEGSGVKRIVSKASDFRLTIPMCGKVESLNASVAAAVAICYLAKSQRGGGGKESGKNEKNQEKNELQGPKGDCW